jgi:hypothetical protein
MILLDYSPGTHGHFLEFVINRYIFNVDFSIDSIFQSTTGSAHVINIDKTYQQNRVVISGHYSSLLNCKKYRKDASKIIFVKHNPKFDFVLLTNFFHRCHGDAMGKDANAELIMAYHKEGMATDATSDKDLRGNWFAKLNERHFVNTEKRAQTDILVFDFNFDSFFDLTHFLYELRRVADYLDMTFKFDVSLVELWNEFIDRNQGYQAYTLGNKLLTHVYNNTSANIPNNWQLHAYMNCVIANAFRLYDGELFESELYPTNTQYIHKIILDHIASFDAKFS